MMRFFLQRRILNFIKSKIHHYSCLHWTYRIFSISRRGDYWRTHSKLGGVYLRGAFIREGRLLPIAQKNARRLFILWNNFTSLSWTLTCRHCVSSWRIHFDKWQLFRQKVFDWMWPIIALLRHCVTSESSG